MAYIIEFAESVRESLKQTDIEPFALSMNPEFREIIEKARDEFRAGKKSSLEEMKQEVL